MGLNFYLVVGDRKKYHLGKSSFGWQFVWDLISILEAVLDHGEELRISPGLTSRLSDFARWLRMPGTEPVLTVDERDELQLRKELRYLNRDLAEKLVLANPWLLKPERQLVVPGCTSRWEPDDLKALGRGVYAEIRVPFLSDSQVFEWLDQLLLLPSSRLEDENGTECTLAYLLCTMNDKTEDWTALSYVRDNPTYASLGVSLEYLIGGMRCSSYTDFS